MRGDEIRGQGRGGKSRWRVERGKSSCPAIALKAEDLLRKGRNHRRSFREMLQVSISQTRVEVERGKSLVGIN